MLQTLSLAGAGMHRASAGMRGTLDRDDVSCIHYLKNTAQH